MESRRTELSGWGRTAPTVGRLVDASVRELREPGVLAELNSHGRGVIARGAGRSYGDPAQNAGGTIVRLDPTDDPWRLDDATGVVTAAAGVTFDELLRACVPRGWFVPVSPGTRFVTVGGAIASDVHGKNHHVDGSFGRFVESIEMLLADGSERTVTEASDPELWWATIGGMGLTGLITRARFRMLPIATSRCLVDTERLPDLDSLLERMAAGDDAYRYSVAWVDMLATGRHLGRSVLTRGDHASVDELAERAPQSARDPLAFDPGHLASTPDGLPNLLSRPAVRAFNEAWYRKAPANRRGIEPITGFFHPLDMVGGWNRVYGRLGFLQYQFVVPFAAVDTLRSIVEDVAGTGLASFVAVLKRFGDESGGMLSFPRPGWTLTIDFAAGADGLGELLAGLDDQVLGAGGRHYLAKDATAGPEIIEAGYPRLGEWLAVRHRVDPDRLWASDQARRLDLL